MNFLRASGMKEPAYTHDEIVKLKGIGRESLRTIHQAKEILLGDIENIERIQQEERRLLP